MGKGATEWGVRFMTGAHSDRTTRKGIDGQVLWLGVALPACVLLAACAWPHRGVDLPMPPRSTGKAVMHAVHNEQLRDVMKGLRGASFDRLPQELDDPSRERASLQEASSHAQELAHAADRIAAIVGETGLTADEEQVFLGLAERLRDRAVALRAQADRRETRRIGTTMKEIDETCASCHTLFRVVPQPSTDGTP